MLDINGTDKILIMELLDFATKTAFYRNICATTNAEGENMYIVRKDNIYVFKC